MNTFFLSISDQQTLLALLRRLPELVEELLHTTSRQDCIGRGGARVLNGSDVQPMPLNVGSASATHELHAELVGWVRLVCESRDIGYTGSGSLLGVGKWLDHNMVPLAMTCGAEEALSSIKKAIDRCWDTVDLPEDDYTWVNPEKVNRAMNKRVTAIEAQRLMLTLGHPPLRADVISRWYARGKVQRDEEGKYRLGDILNLNPRKVIPSADGL